MKPILKADAVIFAESETEEAFNSLSDEDQTKKAILKVFIKLKENVYCGEKIRRKLIPKEYIIKYCIDNLFWYKLTKDWRLVYSIVGNNIEVVAVIIDYFNHKGYERKFHY